eukprot:s5715_g3.t1
MGGEVVVPSQSLQPPSLTVLTAPLTQEDGWWRRGRRRDDDDATTSTGGRDGAERTEGDVHLQGSLFGAESGDGGPDGGPLGAVRAGRCFLDWLVVEEVTQLDVGLWADIAGQAGDGVAEPRVAQELRVGLGEVVAAVGLQGAHGLLEPRAEEDVVRESQSVLARPVILAAQSSCQSNQLGL